jgi:hypothetical protein
MVSKRVFITLPTELIEKANKYNFKHPETHISYSAIAKKGLEEFLRTATPDQQEPEKSDDDLDEIRDKWYQKNQQRILETTGKMEPNWNNILVKNPELGFKNSKELKNWILDRVSPNGTRKDSYPSPTTNPQTTEQ